MKRISFTRWLGTGLLAVALGAGCTHAPVQQVAEKPCDPGSPQVENTLAPGAYSIASCGQDSCIKPDSGPLVDSRLETSRTFSATLASVAPEATSAIPEPTPLPLPKIEPPKNVPPMDTRTFTPAIFTKLETSPLAIPKPETPKNYPAIDTTTSSLATPSKSEPKPLVPPKFETAKDLPTIDRTASSQSLCTKPEAGPQLSTKLEAPKLIPSSLVAAAEPLAKSGDNTATVKQTKLEFPSPADTLSATRQTKLEIPSTSDNLSAIKQTKAEIPSTTGSLAAIKQTKLEVPSASETLSPARQTRPEIPNTAKPLVVDAPPVKKATPEPQCLEAWATKSTPEAEAVQTTVATAAMPADPPHATPNHAADYRWLCGELQYSRFHKTWRVRYGGLDEIDPYGGSVTLSEDVRLNGLRDGQHVRVEGRLVSPGERAIAPPYELTSIQVIEK